MVQLEPLCFAVLHLFLLCCFSVPRISLQLRLHCLHSIALCMLTLNRHYTASLAPSLPFSFSLHSLTQVHVPWQRPWRHRWLHEPPCSALSSQISFGIESWGEVAGSPRHQVCLLIERGDEERQPNEWPPQRWTCDKGNAGLCWVYNSMCMSRSDISCSTFADVAGISTSRLLFIWNWMQRKKTMPLDKKLL